MELFFESIQLQFDKKLPFVVYNKPNSKKNIAFLSFDDALVINQKLDKKGFVFAPFDGNDFVFFDEVKSEIIKFEGIDFNEKFNHYNDDLPTLETKEFHICLVENGVEAIQKNKFLKVVLSRKELVLANQNHFINYYKKLVQTYKSAFCYCFYHPKVGMWLGATPEQLVKIEKDIISTVALAGTQLAIENQEVVFWEDKEKDEQLFVTQFIEKSLSPFVEIISKSEPYTAQAGNLLHIKTDISAKLKSEVSLSDVVLALHPTPALCGLPKQEAKEFIIQNEGYNRNYYSGFLGEINKDFENNEDDKSDIFVNLRCMELETNQANLFIGGGITKDSDPESEFLETINKSQTIKKIIK